MKVFILLVALVYALMAVDAKDAAFALDYEDNYKVALAKAKKVNKPLMLIVVQNPCPYCTRLVENTLEDARVKAKLEDFVPLIVDKHDELPEQFTGTPVPMAYFIDPRIEKSTYQNLGFLNAEDFVKLLTIVQSLTPKKI